MSRLPRWSRQVQYWLQYGMNLPWPPWMMQHIKIFSTAVMFPKKAKAGTVVSAAHQCCLQSHDKLWPQTSIAIDICPLTMWLKLPVIVTCLIQYCRCFGLLGQQNIMKNIVFWHGKDSIDYSMAWACLGHLGWCNSKRSFLLVSCCLRK